jgi:NTP pyrophosphatase (non-canonical NTP hydrolase)
MNLKEYLLTCLAEEAAEVSQGAAKAIRFGLDDRYPDAGSPTTEAKLLAELNDLLGVVALCQIHGILPNNLWDRGRMDDKQEKVRKYMEYSRKVGTLEERKPHANT